MVKKDEFRNIPRISPPSLRNWLFSVQVTRQISNHPDFSVIQKNNFQNLYNSQEYDSYQTRPLATLYSYSEN